MMLIASILNIITALCFLYMATSNIRLARSIRAQFWGQIQNIERLHKAVDIITEKLVGLAIEENKLIKEADILKKIYNDAAFKMKEINESAQAFCETNKLFYLRSSEHLRSICIDVVRFIKEEKLEEKSDEEH